MNEERVKLEAAAREEVMSIYYQMKGIVVEMQEIGFGHMADENLQGLIEGMREARRQIGREWLSYVLDAQEAGIRL